MVLRFLVALTMGVGVFLLSLLAVWRMSADVLMGNATLVAWTRGSLRSVDHVIQEQYAEAGKPFPQTLKEIAPFLKGEKFPNSSLKIVRRGVPIDGWGRPLLYSAQGTSYTLASYGRDGKPGGAGLDIDIRGLDLPAFDETVLYEDSPMPSLHQFLVELPAARGMLDSCILSGVIAFLASLYLIRSFPGSMQSVLMLAFKLLATLLVAVFFATIIMQLHIPSGH